MDERVVMIGWDDAGAVLERLGAGAWAGSFRVHADGRVVCSGTEANRLPPELLEDCAPIQLSAGTDLLMTVDMEEMPRALAGLRPQRVALRSTGGAVVGLEASWRRGLRVWYVLWRPKGVNLEALRVAMEARRA